MSQTFSSYIHDGPVGRKVLVECQLASGLPYTIIVGSAGRAVREARDRLRVALTASGYRWPRKRITINLSPADVAKSESSLDLAMAASILQASQQLAISGKQRAFIGEVGLDGSVRPVRGIIGKLLAAKRDGIQTVYIASHNLAQAQLVPGFDLYPLNSLAELGSLTLIKPVASGTKLLMPAEISSGGAIQAIVGQAQAKRAVQIAAGGGHNLILRGPPGTGKSLLAQAIAELLPPLNHDAIMELTDLYSLQSTGFEDIMRERPVRAPHHSANVRQMLGGGNSQPIGELSLAHHGVLLLDELPEFSRSAIEALRAPLQDKAISLPNARLPANCLIVGTANPCPCGFSGSSTPCRCSGYQIERYSQKLSGPLLDRFDLLVNLGPTEHTKLLQANSSDQRSLQQLRQTIRQAHGQQQRRYQSHQLNSDASDSLLTATANLEEKARDLLNAAAEHLQLSARAYIKVVRVARTIADLGLSPAITPAHIAEAVQFRPPNSGAG